MKKILLSLFVLFSAAASANEDRAYQEESMLFFISNPRAKELNCDNHFRFLSILYSNKDMYANVFDGMGKEIVKSEAQVATHAVKLFRENEEFRNALKEYSKEQTRLKKWHDDIVQRGDSLRQVYNTSTDLNFKSETNKQLDKLSQENEQWYSEYKTSNSRVPRLGKAFANQKITINGNQYSVVNSPALTPQTLPDKVRIKLDLIRDNPIYPYEGIREVVIDIKLPINHIMPQMEVTDLYNQVPFPYRGQNKQVYSDEIWNPIHFFMGYQKAYMDTKNNLYEFSALSDYQPIKRSDEIVKILKESKSLEEFYSKANQASPDVDQAKCFALLENNNSSHQVLGRGFAVEPKQNEYSHRDGARHTTRSGATESN